MHLPSWRVLKTFEEGRRWADQPKDGLVKTVRSLLMMWGSAACKDRPKLAYDVGSAACDFVHVAVLPVAVAATLLLLLC